MRRNKDTVEKGSQAYYERQVAMGRSALLVVLCLTALNLVLLLAGSNTYLLFSASVPYYLTALARGFDLAAYGSVNQGYTWAALAVSLVVLGLFLLCWFLSRNAPQLAHRGRGAVCDGYHLPGPAVPVHLRRLCRKRHGFCHARLGALRAVRGNPRRPPPPTRRVRR